MEWKEDMLGDGYEMAHVEQGMDYTGPVRCTVVRLLSAKSTRRAVLYIHGFSDYFFQKEEGRQFASHGYNFYAVDLRRYGRSLRKGDKMFRVKDMREYFADIRAGIEAIKSDGNEEIVLVGHSTGGLTTSLYMEEKPDPAIKALVLNSPFLTWNLPGWMVKGAIPVLKGLARFFPHIPVKGDGTDKYASAVARHLDGEWDYRTEWKPDVMPDVDAEWIKAIDDAQRAVRRGAVKVPVLLLHSSRSAGKNDPKERFHDSDGVLNVTTMAEVGRRLGPDVTEVTIDDGLHDLVLSRREVREKVYEVIFSWLSERHL